MRLLLLCGVGVTLSACDVSGTHTLYRNSVLDSTARYHISTFDSSDGDKYNAENCQIAADLFQQQPGVRTRFWCEKGTFRK
ncbi:hypothetical protein GHT07_20625 [Caenimonas koreensis DSM 17982]|uniref:Uncharacterized protein n=1 Tax=Caenimonas koreensis DSM 17982 TaxID=1121255 RepID=A0A844B976_9BURK|nr:hypothetical protein [Caenimonas koreensis]MRD49682.1 hypothetical protein [Caenimonas koreensis DSM 17982]